MTDRAKRKIVYVFIAVLLTLGLGTWFYHKLEGWSWVDSLYFAASTITTVGYGDLSVTHDVSKLFTVLYMFVGIAIVVYSFPLMGEYYVERRMQVQKRLEESRFAKILQPYDKQVKHDSEDNIDDANPLPGTNHARHGQPKR
ncbi:two pore domain potassium channel family protein [Candidatus Micrarchaeota archaeon]|nr:two pore domain potassium channel family protein [Candidatus Micrarchaeota archaeon]